MDNRDADSIYLSVIVPMYNEEGRIEATLQSIDAYLSRQTYKYEIIAVDDGSKDNTVSIVSKLISHIPCLRLIQNEENHGKGCVVKQGMLKASGRIRLFMDADNSTSIDQFERMIPYFDNGYDVVIGSRRIGGSVISVHQSWIRENVGRAFNLVVRTLHGIPMQDTQAGFKALTAEAANKVFPLQTIWRWVFDVELLVISRKLGMKIKEVPIVWKNDGRSHVKISNTLKTFLELIKVKRNFWSGLYDQK